MPILRQRIVFSTLKFERQSGTIIGSRCRPDMVRKLVLEARPDRVALVLRDRKMTTQLAFGVAGIVSKEKPTRHWKPGVTHHVGVAHESRELVPMNEIEFPFSTVDDCFIKRDGETDS